MLALAVRDAVTVRDHRAYQELWRAHIGRAPVKMGECGGHFEAPRRKELTARTGRGRAPVPGRAPVKMGEWGAISRRRDEKRPPRVPAAVARPSPGAPR